MMIMTWNSSCKWVSGAFSIDEDEDDDIPRRVVG